MGEGSQLTFGNIAGGIHDSKFAGRDIVEVVIQLVQQTGGQMPSPRNLPAQAAALRQALPLLDPAARASIQTALDHLAQAIADLPRCEQAYLDRLKDKYAEETGYYIPLSGQTTEILPASSSAHASRAARRRAHRAEAEYHEWIASEREIKRVKLNTLREGVDKYPCLILLGDPGCGKTTALEHLAYQFASESSPLLPLRQAQDTVRSPAPLLPLPLRLSDFTPGLTLEDWIAEGWGGSIEAGHWGAPELAANLEGYLEAGRLFFLFDALNEMPRDGYRERAAALRRFIDRWRLKGNRFLVTCRVLDYGEELSGLQRIEIQPLNDEQIHTFLQNELPDNCETLWNILSEDNPALVNPPEARRAKSKIANPQRTLLELARNPYLLTIMIDIFLEDGQLGQNRAELLTRFTQIRMADEKRKCPSVEWLNAKAQQESLSVMAFEMQKRAGSGATVETELVKTVMPLQVEINPNWPPIPTPPDQILTLAARANLIEMPVDRASVRFYHQALQEYFAARQLLKQVKEADLRDFERLWRWPWLETGKYLPFWLRIKSTVHQWFKSGQETELPQISQRDFHDPLPPPPSTGWEETTILTVGLATMENDNQLLQALIHINPILAGRCLYEGRVEVDKVVKQKVIDELLLTIARPEVGLRVRIAAGEILGYLGDPRLGEMITIPAGEFLMGGGWIGENPKHKLYLPDYAIGKYPVTYMEYSHFIKTGEYQNKRWWTKTGWIQKEKEAWTEPRFWQDARFGKPNQPVVGVSWYECVAYCRWLSAETGQLYRLPTEAEWEKMARGTDGRSYPWGNKVDVSQLNSNEGEQVVMATTPVGIYPTGISPFGAFDCAGNVCEWCTTKTSHQGFKPYPYDVTEDEWAVAYLEGANARALRGGSWAYTEYTASCTNRLQHDPYDKGTDSYNGFRMTTSSIGK